jgi:hypothetical protein
MNKKLYVCKRDLKITEKNNKNFKEVLWSY